MPVANSPRRTVSCSVRIASTLSVVLYEDSSLRRTSVRPVVHLHGRGAALLVLDRDVLEERHEADLVERLVVVLGVGVALGRSLVVVERDARRDDVDHAGALVADRGLEDREQLLLVAGERARHERRAQLDGQRADVDGRQVVDHAVLERAAEVGRRRELALGEAVAAVVLDDVDQRQVAPHQVHELADADRAGVAVAAHADAEHRLVGHAARRWPPTACARARS